jgi:hypothetical protein
MTFTVDRVYFTLRASGRQFIWCYHRAVNKPSSTRGKLLENAGVPLSGAGVDRSIMMLQAVADSETDLAAADIARQLRLLKHSASAAE